MTSKMAELAERVRTRREVSRMEDLHRDNDRLQLELRTVRSELDRDRDERSDLLDALKSSRVQKVVKKKKRRGLLSVLVVGTGAYILGAKAGRERYEEILQGARALRKRVRARTDDDERDAEDDVLVVPATGSDPEMALAQGSGLARSRAAREPNPTTTTTPTPPITPRDGDQKPPLA